MFWRENRGQPNELSHPSIDPRAIDKARHRVRAASKLAPGFIGLRSHKDGSQASLEGTLTEFAIDNLLSLRCDRLLSGKRFREGIVEVCLDLFFIITAAPWALRPPALRLRCVRNGTLRNVPDDVVQRSEAS